MADSNNQSHAWPEIVPKFSDAIPLWQAAWPIHIYLSVSCYIVILLISIYLLYIYTKDWKGKKGSNRHNHLALTLYVNLLLCSLLRALALIIDPYASNPTILPVVFHVLWALSVPAFTAAFTMLLLALLESTKKYKTPPIFQNGRNIAIIVAINFAFVLTIEFIVERFFEARVLLIVCQGTYILFNLFLSTGYLIAARKISRNIVSVAQGFEEEFNRKLRRLIMAIYSCSLISFMTCASHIYAMVGVYNVYSPVRYAQPWPWWAFQSIQRGLELALCFSMLLIIWGKNKTKKSPNQLATEATFHPTVAPSKSNTLNKISPELVC